MTITYRTNGAWGTGKGSNLTAAEIDGNFYDLDGRVAGIESNPPSPDEISNITVSGSQMTIWLASGASFGPFTLPQAAWRPPVVATVATDTYTLTLNDQNRYLRFTHLDGCVVTVPSNANVAFPIGTEIILRKVGAIDHVILTGQMGVQAFTPEGLPASSEYLGSTIRIKKVDTDIWDIIGYGFFRADPDTAT